MYILSNYKVAFMEVIFKIGACFFSFFFLLLFLLFIAISQENPGFLQKQTVFVCLKLQEFYILIAKDFYISVLTAYTYLFMTHLLRNPNIYYWVSSIIHNNYHLDIFLLINFFPLVNLIMSISLLIYAEPFCLVL